MLAALAPRFGGSVTGADRSAETARVNSLDHCLARARTERAGVRWPHRRRADRIFTDSLAPWRRSTASSSSTRSLAPWRRSSASRGRPGRWRRGIIEVDRRSTASSRSTRTTGRCELGGLLRQHPLRRSAATALLAPLLLRFGGSVSGADRSADLCCVPDGNWDRSISSFIAHPYV